MDYKKLIIALIIPQLAGFVGSFFNVGNGWYNTLIKPSFNPPSWIFGPVWITLYFLMGITLYLIWTSKKNEEALKWFWIQLGLNAVWSIIFFGMKNISLAFVNIVLLEIAIIVLMLKSYKLNKNIVYLLIPYLLWVSFATILNFSILILNL